MGVRNGRKTIESKRAGELSRKLTKKEKDFCHAYVYLTGMDGFKAAEIAGYEFSNNVNNIHQAKTNRNMMVKRLLSKTDVVNYIVSLRKELNNQLLVDKLYIMEKLKDLSVAGENDSIKLKALIEMAKLQGLYEDKIKVESVTEDPSKIIQDAFKARKEGKYLEFSAEAKTEEEVDYQLEQEYGDEDEDNAATG